MALPVTWNGVLAGRRPERADVEMQMALSPSNQGGSGTFLAKASNGNRYWVKVLNNPQGIKVPITEQIVGRVGTLIGAPCCTVQTISIPPELAGWEFRPGAQLQPGIGHASMAMENVLEVRQLGHRSDDANSRRHALVHALYDWCWGEDAQWLVAVGDENRYHSHDHGWYLPPSGPDWTHDALMGALDTPKELASDWAGISKDTALFVASRLEVVSRDQLITALAGIPRDWPVTDFELESVGFFLEHRAPQVAERIRARYVGEP